MNRSFSEYISDKSEIGDVNELPMSHIFNSEYLYSFYQKGEIPETYLGKCDVFDDYLIYFFYGRPAFKLNDIFAYPVCFILENVDNPTKIFPFDSGAFVGKRMNKFFGDENVDKFDVKNMTNVHKLVDTFYLKREEDYYDTRPKSQFEENNLAAKAYYRLLTEDTLNMDERKSSIEFIFNSSIKLENLKMCIIPEDRKFNFGGINIDSDELGEMITKKYPCRLEKYTLTPDVNKNYKKIYSIVRDFIF